MMTMLKKIKRVVEKTPNKIAYKVNDKSITYKELWNRANEYADLLKRQGTSPVIIYGHKEINVIIAILSCIIADRPYVPIGPCTPLYRVKQIISLTKSTLILTENSGFLDEIECLSLNELKKYENSSLNEIKNGIAYIIFTSGREFLSLKII